MPLTPEEFARIDQTLGVPTKTPKPTVAPIPAPIQPLPSAFTPVHPDVFAEIDRGLTVKDERNAIARQAEIDRQKAEQSDRYGNFIGRATVRGVENTIGSLGGLAAIGGELINNEPLKETGMAVYKSMSEKAAEIPGVEFGEIRGPLSAAKWSVEKAIENAPFLISGFGTAAVGRSIASKVIPKVAGDFLVKQAAKKVGAEAGEQLIGLAAKNIAQSIGAKAGIVASTAAIESGGDYADLVERGLGSDKAALSTLATGVAKGFIETMGGPEVYIDRILGTQTGGIFRKAVNSIGSAFNKGVAPGPEHYGVIRRIIGETMKRGKEEGLEEILQESLALANIGYNDPTFKMFTAQNLGRILESGAGGFAVGGITGIPGGAFTNRETFARERGYVPPEVTTATTPPAPGEPGTLVNEQPPASAPIRIRGASEPLMAATLDGTHPMSEAIAGEIAKFVPVTDKYPQNAAFQGVAIDFVGRNPSAAPDLINNVIRATKAAYPKGDAPADALGEDSLIEQQAQYATMKQRELSDKLAALGNLPKKASERIKALRDMGIEPKELEKTKKDLSAQLNKWNNWHNSAKLKAEAIVNSEQIVDANQIADASKMVTPENQPIPPISESGVTGLTPEQGVIPNVGIAQVGTEAVAGVPVQGEEGRAGEGAQTAAQAQEATAGAGVGVPEQGTIVPIPETPEFPVQENAPVQKNAIPPQGQITPELSAPEGQTPPTQGAAVEEKAQALQVEPSPTRKAGVGAQPTGEAVPPPVKSKPKFDKRSGRVILHPGAVTKELMPATWSILNTRVADKQNGAYYNQLGLIGTRGDNPVGAKPLIDDKSSSVNYDKGSWIDLYREATGQEVTGADFDRVYAQAQSEIKDYIDGRIYRDATGKFVREDMQQMSDEEATARQEHENERARLEDLGYTDEEIHDFQYNHADDPYFARRIIDEGIQRADETIRDMEGGSAEDFFTELAGRAAVEPTTSEVKPTPTEKVLYHGTNAEYAGVDIDTGKRMYGIHLTTSEDAAKEYGKVKKYTLSRDAKVIDLSDGDTLWEFMAKEGILDEQDIQDVDLERYVKDGQLYQYDVSSNTNLADDVAKTVKSLGYDVVKMPDNLIPESDNIAYVVVNKSVLKPTTAPEAPTPEAAKGAEYYDTALTDLVDSSDRKTIIPQGSPHYKLADGRVLSVESYNKLIDTGAQEGLFAPGEVKETPVKREPKAKQMQTPPASTLNVEDKQTSMLDGEEGLTGQKDMFEGKPKLFMEKIVVKELKNPYPEALDVSPSNPAQEKKKLFGTIAKVLRIKTKSIKESNMDVAREDSKVASQIAKVFGHKIMFIDAPSKTFGGMYYKGNIVVNSSSNAHHVFVLAHELTHSLQNSSPDLYQSLVDVIINNEPGILEEYYNNNKGRFPSVVSKDNLRIIIDEFVADTVGERMSEKSFWDKLYEQVPEVVRVVYDAIVKVISALSRNPRVLNNKYFKDIKKVRDTIDSVMAEYAKREQKPQEPRFATRNADTRPSIPGETVARVAAEVSEKFNIPHRVVATVDNLPQNIREGVASKAAIKGKFILGIYHDGKVWLVAEHMRSEDEVRKIFIHEAAGHFGLRKVMGKHFEDFLDFISGSAKYKAEIAAFAKDNGIEDMREAADEWFAQKAEGFKSTSTAWQRFMFHVRKWLKAIGVKIEFSKPELTELLRQAREAAVEGGEIAPTEGMAFATKDIWAIPEQQYSSIATSINASKLPATFSRVSDWKSGTVNADIGGGRFDNVTEFLGKRGVTNYIYDPFNRTPEQNSEAVKNIRGGQADTATVNNVLNVIQEEQNRDMVIRQAADALKQNGTAYFLIHEGDASGNGKATTKGWQENRKAKTYIQEIQKHFGSVAQRGNLLVAKEPLKITIAGDTSIPDTITIDGKSRPTRNSRGQLIHTTEAGIRNFWKWFGDSKVVDDKGRPLVVYHGTSEDFSVFDTQTLGKKTGARTSSLGFFFSNDKYVAESFGGFNRGYAPGEYYLSLQKPVAIESEYVTRTTQFGSKIPIKDNLGRDRIAKDSYNVLWEYAEGVIGKNKAEITNEDMVGWREKMQSIGTDGIIIKNTQMDAQSSWNDHYIAFSPTQIKSATGNTGAFDAANPDIRFATRPSVSTGTAEENIDDYDKYSPHHLKNTAEIMKSFFSNVEVGDKPDIARWLKVVSLPMHYTKIVPALHRAWQWMLMEPDLRHQFENQMFRKSDGSIKYLENIDHYYKKGDKAEVDRFKKYIVARDINRVGWKVVKTGGKDGEPVVFEVRNPGGAVMNRFEVKESPRVSAETLEIERGEKVGVNKGLTDAEAEMHNQAWEDAYAREADATGFSTDGKNALISYRTVTDKQLDFQLANIHQAIMEIKAKKGKMPKVVEWIDGKRTEISLDAALLRMGQLRGFYMPRLRKQGDFALFSSKEGTNPWLEFFNSKSVMDARRKELEAQGFTVKMDVNKALGNEVFARIQSIAAIQDVLNSTIERMEDDTPLDALDIEDYSSELIPQADGTQTLFVRGRFDKPQRDILRSYGKNTKVTKNEDGTETWEFKNSNSGTPKVIARDLLQYKNIRSDASLEFARLIVDDVANTILSRSSLARRMGRKTKDGEDVVGKDVVLGYETDPLLAITMAGKGIAASSAKHEVARGMYQAKNGTDEMTWEDWQFQNGEGADWTEYRDYINERKLDSAKQPEARKEWDELIAELMRQPDRIDNMMGTLRGVASLMYLWGRVPSAAINMTTLGTAVPAAVSGRTGISLGRAFHLIAAQAPRYIKYARGEADKETTELFDEIKDRGWHTAQFNKEAVSVLKNQLGRTYDTFIDKGMWLFGKAEEINRIGSIAAAYQALKEAAGDKSSKLREDLLEQAKSISDDANGVYTAANLPSWARGSGVFANAARSFYVFRTYTHTYLVTMLDLLSQGGLLNQKGWTGANATAKMAALWMAGAGAIFGGAGSSVLFSAIMAGLKLARDDDPEEALYTWIMNHFGGYGEQIARYGMAGALGINVKGSMQIALGDMPSTPFELLGAPGSIVTNAAEGLGMARKGEWWKGAEKFLPYAVSAPLKAVREATTGITSKSNVPLFYGDEKVRLDPLETALRAFSFQPARVSAIRERQWSEQKMQEEFRNKRNEIYTRIRAFWNEPPNKRDKNEWMKILVRIEEYNENAKRNKQNPITRQQIFSARKLTAKPPKKERERAKELNAK